jgi:predicted enzyme related to lactoylglutathione lyase
MQIVTQYPDGVFSWVDLGTTDPEGAKAFYGGLFGWSFEENPTDSGVVYSMSQIEGYYVAGLGPLDPDMQAQGIPPFWSSYVKHDNVDAVAESATKAGGNVLFPPFDVMDAGRMTMIQDPTGAMFGVWQPAAHIGAQLVNIPNTLTWNELLTRDMEGAKSFYSTVFGWTYETDANGYVAVSQDGRVQAGMMQINESMGEMPPNWSAYFLVEDADTAAARVKELGGNVLVPPTPAGDIGKFAVVQDPQGAVFNIIQYDGPASPPPGY